MYDPGQWRSSASENQFHHILQKVRYQFTIYLILMWIWTFLWVLTPSQFLGRVSTFREKGALPSFLGRILYLKDVWTYTHPDPVTAVLYFPGISGKATSCSSRRLASSTWNSSEKVPADLTVTVAAFSPLTKVAAPYLESAWRATTVSWKKMGAEIIGEEGGQIILDINHIHATLRVT